MGDEHQDGTTPESPQTLTPETADPDAGDPEGMNPDTVEPDAAEALPDGIPGIEEWDRP